MSGPTLAELQRQFLGSIAARPGAGSEGFDPGLLTVIEPSPTLTPAERLAIYADMYLARLKDCLLEDFPRVAERLGPSAWHAFVQDFLAAHPSQHPSVRQLGGRLPAYLAANLPPGASAALAELARFEWARLDVFDGPDAESLTRADLMAVAAERWGELRFTTVPAFVVFDSAWPVHALWAGDLLPVTAPEPVTLRIWRQGFMVYHAPMSPPEATAMRHLMAGEPFAAVCGAIADGLSPEEAAPKAVGWLARWIEDGVLAAPLPL